MRRRFSNEDGTPRARGWGESIDGSDRALLASIEDDAIRNGRVTLNADQIDAVLDIISGLDEARLEAVMGEDL